MLAKLLVSAAICVSSGLSNNDFYLSPKVVADPAILPEPGSVSATLSVASLNNIL